MAAESRRDWSRAPTVLIASDDEAEAGRLASLVEAERWLPVRVGSREAAVNVLDSVPIDALVTCLRRPRIPGLNLLALARTRNPDAGAVLLVDPGQEEPATQALARGAIDFQQRPLNLEKLRESLRRLFETQRLGREVAELRRRLDRTYGFTGVIGGSGAMLRVLSRLREVAPLDAAVLLIGEAGVGKELIAGVIHQNSPRRNGPFVTLDCAAVGGRHLAHELLGAPARGARPRRPGRLELARHGTLHLAGVARMPRDLQARLAEALRAGQVRGDLERPPIEVDVRAVCSSELDLRGEVEQGRFHEGLFAQVAAVEIPLPPLRHRRRDIPRLSRHFLAEHARSRGAAITLGRDALDLLQRYDWPGNLDELRAVVEDLAESLPPGAAAGAADLPESIRTRGAPDGVVVPRGTALRDVERTLIEEAMRAAGGNREKAARALGMGVRTLYRKIKAYQEAQPRPGSRRAER